MCKYEVRIEGAEIEEAFTLDELLDNGFLDEYDPLIQVRAKGETQWITARDYPYGERENGTTSGFIINEDGTVTRTVKKKTNIARNFPSNGVSTSNQNTSISSITESNPTSKSVDWGEIMEWVIAIAIGVGLAIILT